jgi:hypothetical protein
MGGASRFSIEKSSMSKGLPAHTKDRLARIYGAGIVGFIVTFGSITLFATFLANLK